MTRGLLLLYAVVLLGTLSGVSLLEARGSSGWVVAMFAAASLAYAALRQGLRHPPRSYGLLLGCVLVGVVWRILLIPQAPLLSDDVYRYVWDGRVQRFHHNPYESIPDDPALADLQTEVTRRIHPVSAALPTIYPPAAEWLFWSIASVDESVGAFVTATVVCDLLTIALLWRWHRGAGRSPWWVLAYAWHPLVAVEGAGGGHIDIVGMLFVVVAAVALAERRTILAPLALAVAFSLKFLPIVLLPLFWRRVPLRAAWAGVGLIAALYVSYLPVWDGTVGLPVGSLRVYAESWRFNAPLFGVLEPWLGTFGVLGLSVGGGLAAAVVARARLAVDDPRAWAWPMAVALLLMPAVYPWYLVWLTPFLITRGTWPLTLWTLASLATYAVWLNETAGVGWVLPAWVIPAEYGLVISSALWVVWKRDPGDGRQHPRGSHGDLHR